MSQVHKLVTRRDETSKEAVEILEKYLEMAKCGEIIAVAICGIMPDGGAMHQASATQHQVTLLGGVVRLLHRLNVNADEAANGI